MPNNLFTSEDQITPDEGSVPSYLIAADNHNLGNTQGGSWFDPDTWSTKLEGAGKLITTGLLSGANSFYNTGVTVGNWFGAEAEKNDTSSWISSLDSDLGAYYDKNKQAADLVGFIAGSFIPGTLGVKVLNAGQRALRAAEMTGYIGENLSTATGLLVPQTERYIGLAIGDITKASATFSSITQNGVKALASGVWQNVLEGAAFETAVQATMSQSPILSQQDGWDIVKNIATAGVFNGAVGGAFAAAKTFGAIRTGVEAEQFALKPFSSRATIQEGLSPANKIILMAEDRDFAPMVLSGAENSESATAALTDRLRRTNNDIRTNIHSMIKGQDPEIGNMVADSITGLQYDQVLNNLLGAEQISRVGVLSDIEKEANKLVKDGKSVYDLQTTYVKLIGENAGVATDTEPQILNLADKFKDAKAVMDEVRTHGFKLSDAPWNATDLKGSTGHFEAEARHIWADKILKEIPDNTLVHENDIPLLERAFKDGQQNIKLVGRGGKVISASFASPQEAWKQLVAAKDRVALTLSESSKYAKNIEDEGFRTQAISKITNVKLSRLEGTALGSQQNDYLAWQSASSDYAKFLEAKGLKTPANPDADTRFLPSYAKIAKRVPEDLQAIDGNTVAGMTWIKTQQAMLQGAVNNVVSKATGALYDSIPEIKDSTLLNANSYGAGAGLFKFANGGYGSLESNTQLLGSITKTLKTQFRKDTEEALQGSLAKMGQSQEAAIEFQTINQKVSRSAAQWIFDDGSISGERGLIQKKAIDPKTGELLESFDATTQHIPISTDEASNFIQAHIGRAGERTSTYSELRAAQGLTDVKDPAVFRPIRTNSKDYPYFAFVKDAKVTGAGHTTMIFADSESKLSELINKVPSEFQVLTKKDTEEFFAARNEYDYQRTLNESYIDSNLKNKGIYSDFFTKTDPQKIVDDILQQHVREDDVLAMELMRAKNQKAFNWLEDQGAAYGKLSSSTLGGSVSKLEAAGKNPYLDYIKTSLDISKASEHPLIYGFNKFLDTAVSKAVGAVKDTFDSLKSYNPQDLDKINGLLDKYGMNTGYRDAATDLLVNHTAPKGELSKFIRGANAVLAKLTLGLDPLNALNNAIGANILRTTELKQITDAIRSGDSSIAGDLTKVAKVSLPGTGDNILSPTKLMANALQNYVKDDGTLLAQYKAAGYIKDATEQFKSILDDFSLRGTETVPDLTSRLARAIQKTKDLSAVGERYSGNKLAEEFNRFISADVMRQLTDPAVKGGILTKAEQTAYMNTFVNRVEGNIIASQRPIMFQGPMGQAIGLFQSYQFNLMQQMFRYVAEGTAKDSAMLLGLQGTFYGLQGLPGFQFINQHIVGTLSGNDKHIDLYDSTYGIAGKTAGDWLMYGLPSNILQNNLYGRGDINPRQVTILPSSLSELPIVSAYGKFFSSIKDAIQRSSAGAPVWESMLQGLEHNGLSRPLAGLAQTLQATTGAGNVFSTTSKGSILYSNDLASWATATRLLGGRPLDEAIINDGVFRIQAYQQYNSDQMKQLGEAIKTSGIQGQSPDQDDISKFAQQYVESGGKQAQFNKYMMGQLKSANTPQANKIVSQLKNPFAQKMQVLMGGGSDVDPLSQIQ